MRRFILLPVAWLVGLHLAVIGAGFFSPHDPAEQNRSAAFAPPTRVRFIDTHGQFHWSPFVCGTTSAAGSFLVVEDCSREYPIRWFTARVRLFGVEPPGAIHLMGTDEFGRDQFSRFLHGGRISLFAGLLACCISLGLALVLGVTAGFYGRWIDDGIMGVAELSLALPWLYLLFAVRAFLPLEAGPATAFLLVSVLVGVLGWARPARLLRGAVLSAREREYVLAARGFGASDSHVIRTHIIPQVGQIALTQAALLAPRYILAEVTLSFLGLGVNEPAASWGNMISALQQYHVLTSYWWMFLPALLLVPTFLAYIILATSKSNNTS